MTTLPSHKLVFSDSTGLPFGVVHLAPSESDPLKGDCIFDMEARTPAQDCRDEVRWLAKRHYQRWSEHKFAVDDDGVITIKKASFSLILDPAEDGEGFVSRPPAPRVTASWGD
ncbi:MAG: hypothetical protein R3F61_37035 [Myxococcota bacterium]